MSKQSLFPSDFKWGASTSAHQTEGGNKNDWTEWESIHAPRHAQVAREVYKRGEIVWGDTHDRQSTKEENYISGIATDHYSHFPEDFNLAKSMHLNALRLSIEWSRIEPKEGEFDQSEIKHYQEVIRELKTRGIEPFVTLWHWTVPIWFRDLGGWQKQSNIRYFIRYVRKITDVFKDDVTFWITLNEPEIYCTNGYLLGTRPPGHKNALTYIRALRNLISAHQTAYNVIHATIPHSQVGLAKDCYAFHLDSPNLFKHLFIKLAKWWANEYFFNKTKYHQDFLGVNYYIRYRVHSLMRGVGVVEDMGWENAPPGLLEVLQELNRYHKPIYITENGTIDSQDEHRGKYIKAIVETIAKALAVGVDVKGYFHWSLLDNFEWNKGFYFRFGLIEVDYKTLKRHLRPSARMYGQIIQSSTNNDQNLQ